MQTKSSVFEVQDTVESWDSDYYHPIALHYYDRAVKNMLKLMEVPAGATVLDGGCGPGVHSIRVARAGYKVQAIDISETMLTQAKQRVANAGLSDSVAFQQEDLTKLSFPNASFDYVFSWGVIIHIPTIERALDELARIVAPGGKLALYVTNKAAWDHKIEAGLRMLLNKPLDGMQHLPLGDGIWYDYHGEKLWVWRVDTNALKQYLGDRGFTCKHQVIGEFTEIQRRVSGFPRKILLHLNNFCYDMRFAPAAGATNLFVFEKTR